MANARIYVDSCVFVSVLKAEPGTSEMCLSLLEAAEHKNVQLIVSHLVTAEIGGYKGDRPGKAQADQLIERFLENVDAEWSELDILVAREARRVAWQYKLRSADAVHLATAILRRASHFMTLDDGFPLGKNIEGVEVSRPRIVWTPTLLDGEGAS
jgi:predicted nucleic acid-binding protein